MVIKKSIIHFLIELFLPPFSIKVTGRYSVLLPDGRLMIVEYQASKETGYVPKISFVNDANPFTG